MITPEQIAASGSEHAHQTALFAWAAQTGWPQLKWLHAIPNGGQRNKIVAANMKMEGVRSGVADLFLPLALGRFHGFYIEMKKPGREGEKNGGLTDEQVDFLNNVKKQGYRAEVCYTWQQARDALIEYLAYGDA